MTFGEHWASAQQIQSICRPACFDDRGAGPTVYRENGINYILEGDSHIAVVGRTGRGKSSCASIPFTRDILRQGESLIVIDPKKEIYRQTACYIPEGYQVYCVDFTDVYNSPTTWNPLHMIYQLYRSDDPSDRDTASTLLGDMWASIYPTYRDPDPFWPQAAANYGKGLTYALFEAAAPEEINLDSIAAMMEQSEAKAGNGQPFLLKTFYDIAPLDSLAKRNLASYVNAPHETRGSIHACADTGLEMFSRSRGLMQMLSQDSLDILHMDFELPFILYIILPDEHDMFDGLAGLLVSQLTTELIRFSRDWNDPLPIRVNLILEELGSVGQSIPNLPKLATAGRSRNLRLMLILQDYNQLHDVYGPSRAEAILASIGITIGFSTNNWGTLKEWSDRCGERFLVYGDTLQKEPLITPVQLAAMPRGTALILVDGCLKFISPLPMFDREGWTPPPRLPVEARTTSRVFNMLAYTKAVQKQRLQAMMEAARAANTEPAPAPEPELPDRSERDQEIAQLIQQIDSRIAALKAEDPTPKKDSSEQACYVLITDLGKRQGELLQLLGKATDLPTGILVHMLSRPPVKICLSSRITAMKLVRDITALGGSAVVT